MKSSPNIDTHTIGLPPNANRNILSADVHEYLNDRYSSFLIVFTDGAKNNSGVGSAFYIPQKTSKGVPE